MSSFIGRYWLPCLFGALSVTLSSFAVNALSLNWHQWCWWVALVVGVIGTVVSGVWGFRIQQRTSGDSQAGQSARLAGDTYLAADRGGVAAVNIEGGVRTSVPPPDRPGSTPQ